MPLLDDERLLDNPARLLQELHLELVIAQRTEIDLRQLRDAIDPVRLQSFTPPAAFLQDVEITLIRRKPRSRKAVGSESSRPPALAVD